MWRSVGDSGSLGHVLRKQATSVTVSQCTHSLQTSDTHTKSADNNITVICSDFRPQRMHLIRYYCCTNTAERIKVPACGEDSWGAKNHHTRSWGPFPYRQRRDGGNWIWCDFRPITWPFVDFPVQTHDLVDFYAITNSFLQLQWAQ